MFVVTTQGPAIAEGRPGAATSAVVVHFRADPLQLTRCVEACRRDPAIVEVIVVDNEGATDRLRRASWASAGSDDGVGVRILEMPRNLGYGRAANAGLAAMSGTSALVLNQDAVLSERAVSRLLEAGHAAGAWIAGPQLVDASGSAAEAKEHFPRPISWPPPERGLPVASPGCRFVPWISGAVMLFMPGHADLRFDDRFFMYVEDEELCSRVWDADGRVVRVDDVEVVHEGGTAAEARWSRAQIALRIAAGRARFVQSRCGTVAALGYVGSATVDRVRRAFTQRSA